MTPRFWIHTWILLSLAGHVGVQSAELRPFTSQDAAEFSYFGNIADSSVRKPYDDGATSPDGRFVIKITHKGVFPEGVNEGTIWLFEVGDIVTSIEDPANALTKQIALTRMSAAANGYSADYLNRGNTVLHSRWSDDSRSVYFLGRNGQENRQLFKVDVESLERTVLSPNDRDAFAFSVAGPHIALLMGQDVDTNELWRTSGGDLDDVVTGTGTALMPLLFPNFLDYAGSEPLVLGLWQVEDGVASPLRDEASGKELQINAKFDAADISVSPDGSEVVVRTAFRSQRAPNPTGDRWSVIDMSSAKIDVFEKLQYANLDWKPFLERTEKKSGRIELSVHESLNQPPVLKATDTDTAQSRIIFDPNPQFAELQILPVTEFEWEDQHGRTNVGGLLVPDQFEADQSFPLVIQTHGFNRNRFFRVGYAETANAGRALASKGIVVLQVAENHGDEEMPIDFEKAGLDVYLAAIDELASRGIADPEKVGITGYSFTGLTVAASITRAPERFAAAVIANADPLTLSGYYSYVDSPLHGEPEEYFTGVSPFGEGLNTWIDQSPSMATELITAPVLVSVTDPGHLWSLWDFYAALRYQQKAVELHYIRSSRHNIGIPIHRVAHQEMIVDWFDFWLNEHEDVDPGKADQYRRWREMN